MIDLDLEAYFVYVVALCGEAEPCEWNLSWWDAEHECSEYWIQLKCDMMSNMCNILIYLQGILSVRMCWSLLGIGFTLPTCIFQTYIYSTWWPVRFLFLLWHWRKKALLSSTRGWPLFLSIVWITVLWRCKHITVLDNLLILGSKLIEGSAPMSCVIIL